ncbi:hypothetical protein QIW31_04530 [Francisellaceae bacterium CB299]
MSGFEFNWNDLPNICKQDIEIKSFILYLTRYYQVVDDSKYSECRENIYITDYVEEYVSNLFKTYLLSDEIRKIFLTKIKQKSNTSKKEIVRFIINEFNNSISEKGLLIYFSGLYRVKLEYSSNLTIELCDENDSNFIFIKGCYRDMRLDDYLQISKFAIIPSKRLAIIERICFKNISCFVVESGVTDTSHKINVVIKRIQFENMILHERVSSISWFTSINIQQKHRAIYINSSTLPNVDFVNNSDTQEHEYIFENSTLKEIKLIAHLRKIKFRNTVMEKLKCDDKLFISLPYFDDKSTVKHSVDINKATFDNLLKVKQSGSLEFSRLAEFFNRNNAYMEGQQLHRHYLLAKAKESKSRGLKAWVWFYDTINGCGTSLLKPFLFLVLLFSINCNIYFYLTNIIGADIFYKAIDNSLPFAGAFTINNEIISLGVISALKITSIFATLLLFLIALQIRKLLKLKE